jgi:hypothetical protein
MFRLRARAAAIGIVTLFVASCAGRPVATTVSSPAAPRRLPALLASSAEVVAPDAPDYARADVKTAEKKPGAGGVSSAIAIRLTQDVHVFRLWSGPDKKDSRGFTNRIGGWWTYDAPAGTAAQYRVDYEVCRDWNDLTWVATCTLKKGAIVAIGPGNSVGAGVCKDTAEQYPANPQHWQLYVSNVFANVGPGKELECPDASGDYEANPNNLAVPKPREQRPPEGGRHE